jgi:hypothetical protein
MGSWGFVVAVKMAALRETKKAFVGDTRVWD